MWPTFNLLADHVTSADDTLGSAELTFAPGNLGRYSPIFTPS